MAKKKPAPKPRAPRTLQGTLVVQETVTKFSPIKQAIATVNLSDGSRGQVFADLASSTISLERNGLPTRVVSLQDLVSTMYYAEERS